MSQIPFLVDTSRILEIISSQIYDSPFAMARENVQNAYDAVLMRASHDGTASAEYSIEVTATSNRIVIRDEGVGMSEQVLRENFWRAGSSGKNNDAARAAGVIGTFGIGAMANFGVCEQLIVETRAVGSDIGIRTTALKSQLSIGQDCISLEDIQSEIPVGTTLTAEVGTRTPIDVIGLRNYLLPFVRFLPVPVHFNGELLSQVSPVSAAEIDGNWKVFGEREIAFGRFKFNAKMLTSGNQFGVVVENVFIDDVPTGAGLWLRQNAGQVMGLRSRFGLAPLPLASHYQFGGYADLPFLQPTAGREALTRESIQQAAPLMPQLELALTDMIKNTDVADGSSAFQQHLIALGRINWASRVSIQLSPGEERIDLGELRTTYPNSDLHWYDGTDTDIINTFSSVDNPLIRISQVNPRRELQRRYLQEVAKLPQVPNTATITETYKPSDLTWSEVDLTLSIARVLRGDYLIDDVSVEWVKISHGVPMLAETNGDRLVLRISRTWSAVLALLGVVSHSSEIMDGMTKDFVRVHVYDRIKAFVPSSQRAGLDALQRTLARRSELYRLEPDDKGELEPLLADYLAGRIDLPAVLSAAANVSAGQTQRVGRDAVATVETVLHDVVNTVVEPTPVQPISAPAPGSPILRPDIEVRERLLTVERELSQLNNHRIFLALSDKLFSREREFFLWPHTTQVAWAGRRIVFLFGLAHSPQSLYYDIELRGNRTAGAAGGTPILTTTIVVQNRIFVPIPSQLLECFKVTTDPIEFYVRFDLLGHQ